MEKVKASYKIEGNEVLRNGVRIAKVEDETLIMEPDCEKFEMVAKGMCVRMKLIPGKSDGNKVSKPVGRPPVKTKPEIAPEPEKAPEMPVKAEIVPNKSTGEVDIKFLMAQNEQAKAEIEALKARLAATSSVPDDTKPMLIPMTEPENPYGIPAEILRSDVPPCPELDYRGTKMPEAVAWLEKYYPAFALKRLGRFYQKRQMLAAKELEKVRQKEREKAERAQFPKGK